MSTESKIINTFIKAFEGKNIDIISPHLADDMTYEVLPSTIGRKMAKTQWCDHAKHILGQMASIKLEHTHIIEHPLFVVVQSNATLVFPNGSFTQEILFLFNFSKDESGVLKIASVVEYADSFKVKEWMAKMPGLNHLPSDSDGNGGVR